MFNTNIILDLLLNRQPFCDISARVIDLSAAKVIEGYVSPVSSNENENGS